MENLPNLINSHNEWLLIRTSGTSFSLQKSEIEIEFSHNKVLFSFLDDKGFQTWRIKDFQTKNEEIILILTRNFDKEREKIRLVPRTLSKALQENLELVRIEKANKIAALIKEICSNIKLVRVDLNKENGRFAQIIVENLQKKQIAVLADVSDQLTPEFLISTAILWLSKLEVRKKNPIGTIWILGEKKQAKKLQQLHALLCEKWKSKLKIFEISHAEKPDLNKLSILNFSDLWRGKKHQAKTSGKFELSRTAQQIINISPNEIDAIFTKNGENLRFHGLPFARIRKVLEKEKVWFGVDKNRQFLTENNLEEFDELIENLKKFRSFDSANKRHELFRLAPEAWLESILRKNIKLLDANLILSPVYHQFRAERDKIDLLALRKDGRLVIIEIKVEADREMIYQTIDYWRKIERQRRIGNLEKANLFGELHISNEPAICYLVAPTLSFHREFEFLSKTIVPEIAIHRFNLAENWRENLKVLERI